MRKWKEEVGSIANAHGIKGRGKGIQAGFFCDFAKGAVNWRFAWMGVSFGEGPFIGVAALDKGVMRGRA
jgi:hypothetical protein